MKTSAYLYLFFVLSSCCERNLIDTIKFTPAELVVNPYDGTENLVFVDNNENIITYDKGSREINTRKVDECDGGCCDHFLVERSDNTFFESEFMKSNLHVVISNDFDKSTGKRSTPYIHFVWDYYEILPYGTGTSFGSLQVDSMVEKGIQKGIFLDSIILRQKLFYDVFAFPGSSTYPERLHGDTLFFTKSKGIIGLKLSDGNLWVLQ